MWSRSAVEHAIARCEHGAGQTERRHDGAGGFEAAQLQTHGEQPRPRQMRPIAVEYVEFGPVEGAHIHAAVEVENEQFAVRDRHGRAAGPAVTRGSQQLGVDRVAVHLLPRHDVEIRQEAGVARGERAQRAEVARDISFLDEPANDGGEILGRRPTVALQAAQGEQAGAERTRHLRQPLQHFRPELRQDGRLIDVIDDALGTNQHCRLIDQMCRGPIFAEMLRPLGRRVNRS